MKTTILRTFVVLGTLTALVAVAMSPKGYSQSTPTANGDSGAPAAAHKKKKSGGCCG